MSLFFYSFLLFAAAVTGQGISFINPAANGTPFSQNPIFAEGSVLDVTWTEGTSSTPTSLVLFQMNGTELLYPFEYLTQNVLNVTSLKWSVFTSKNLAISNMFVMNIFYEGATSPVAVSGAFNISSTATTTSLSSPTSSTASISSTRPGTNTITSTASSSTLASTPTSDTRGGLSTGAKAGIGIGAPLLVVLGVGVGYFIFRRRSQKKATTTATPTAQSQNNAGEKSVAYTPMHEVSGDSAANPRPYEIYTPEHQYSSG